MYQVTATQLIDDLDTKLVIEVTDKLEKKLRSNPNLKPVMVYPYGGNIYSFGDTSNGYLVMVENDKVVYFARHRAIKHNGFKLGRQVLLWRDRNTNATAGFAAHAFFKYLLPKYSALVADQLQTPDGKRFWLVALNMAMNQGHHVYFLDRRSTPNRLVELNTPQDVKHYESDMWGHTEGHKRTFAVISNKPLKLTRA
jgi:hypothetical protein